MSIINQRTKALSISKKVKHTVLERDMGKCIFCGNDGLAEAHYIPRSSGGLGIEQNIVTVCRTCHQRLDQTTDRPKMLKQVKEHLKLWYPNFNDTDRHYKKELGKIE